MIYKTQQLARIQERIEAIKKKKKDDHRAEIAKVKRIMYENFAELLESWLDQPVG